MKLIECENEPAQFAFILPEVSLAKKFDFYVNTSSNWSESYFYSFTHKALISIVV